jgi:hypothetical protein
MNDIPQNPTDDAEALLSIKSKIMSASEYAQRTEAGEKLESTFELREGNKTLYYFGASHTSNPDDPMFAKIEQEMDRFKPEKVYVEGFRRINSATAEEKEKIKTEPMAKWIKDGEALYTAKLAIEKGIEVESPEPGIEEMEHMKTLFKPEDIFSYYIFRVVYQYQNHYKQSKDFGLEHFKKYIQRYIDSLKSNAGWDQETSSRLEAGFWNNLKIDDFDFYARQSDPIPWNDNEQTIVNQVSRESSKFRDEYIVERIAEGLKKHDRVFIVYGSSHAKKQKAALEELIKIVK